MDKIRKRIIDEIKAIAKIYRDMRNLSHAGHISKSTEKSINATFFHKFHFLKKLYKQNIEDSGVIPLLESTDRLKYKKRVLMFFEHSDLSDETKNKMHEIAFDVSARSGLKLFQFDMTKSSMIFVFQEFDNEKVQQFHKNYKSETRKLVEWHEQLVIIPAE